MSEGITLLDSPERFKSLTLEEGYVTTQWGFHCHSCGEELYIPGKTKRSKCGHIETHYALIPENNQCPLCKKRWHWDFPSPFNYKLSLKEWGLIAGMREFGLVKQGEREDWWFVQAGGKTWGGGNGFKCETKEQAEEVLEILEEVRKGEK
jgi:hypothetical protein